MVDFSVGQNNRHWLTMIVHYNWRSPRTKCRSRMCHQCLIWLFSSRGWTRVNFDQICSERDETDLEPLIQYPEWHRFGSIAGLCTGPSIHLIRVKWINWFSVFIFSIFLNLYRRALDPAVRSGSKTAIHSNIIA